VSAGERGPLADVLIIDDDLDNVDALTMIVQSVGHTVRVGYNGEEGMRLAHERSPDLVLLDVEMPILSGPAMALEMLIHNMGLEKVPVILLSGSPDLKRIASEVGTLYFLTKPYRMAEILALVERALVERAAPRRPG
jgi:DNA-binding NtrC family response regulator